MNLNIVNLDCKEWSKSDWRDAYAQYCKYNQFGPMTKREYYDFVNNRHKRLREASESPSKEFMDNHTRGWRNAVQWAKKRGCGLYGDLIIDQKRQKEAQEVAFKAERAESFAIDAMQKIDNLLIQVENNNKQREEYIRNRFRRRRRYV